METVTVIIPNYNHASFLNERIDSVLNQTYQNFEIIILDDCSIDNSLEIIEAYRGHPKVSQIVCNSVNSGSTFKQWEKGVLLAQGKWIWIAESDDIADVYFLEHLIQGASSCENVALVYSATVEIDENGNVQKRNNWADSVLLGNAQKNRCNDGAEEIKTNFFYKNIIPNASAALFRRTCVNIEIFRIIDKMKFAGDWLFWISILERGNICYIANELNFFRCHLHSTRELKSLELERKRFDECLFILKMIKSRYNLRWNLQKHFWIIDEWKSKFSSRNTFLKELFFYTEFPFIFKMEIIYRIMVERIKYKRLCRS